MAKPEVTGRRLDYLTDTELADELRVHRSTLKRWRMSGTGPAFVKVGRRPIYMVAAVNTWLKRKEQQPPLEAAE
jgi:Helix-turn-helix domain